MIRIGNGFDVHRLVEGRKLILGGIKIPYKKGLLGHSDADVLIHSIIDALLGACGERDIGTLFPDNNSSYKNISSIVLLKKVVSKVEDSGYVIGNIDSVIVAEKPKLSPYIEEIRENIASSIGLRYDQVNVKATTTEELGYIGQGQGISSYAVACIFKKEI